jgi:ring-1,2-phenylacetyl-CoA epoxidase subunit PaaD
VTAQPAPVVDLAVVRAAAGGVPDPELPVITLAQLGMVHDVVIEADGRVVVELLPTFSGCPATDMMSRDVVAAVQHAAGIDVGVRWLFSPVWSSRRITTEGHERLIEFGIAPPSGGGPISTIERPAGARSLPVAGDVSLDLDAPPDQPVLCPYCRGMDVVEDSPFGPTPCRASWFCASCQQPFELFKEL